jgi:hypothetical protein
MHHLYYIFTCINKKQQTTQDSMTQLRTNLFKTIHFVTLLVKSDKFHVHMNLKSMEGNPHLNMHPLDPKSVCSN